MGSPSRRLLVLGALSIILFLASRVGGGEALAAPVRLSAPASRLTTAGSPADEVAILWESARAAFDEHRIDEGMDYWLDAFSRAPYFSPLVHDLQKRGLRDEVLAWLHRGLSGPRRAACLMVLGALDPDPRSRLAAISDFHAMSPHDPSQALVEVWEALTLVEASERIRQAGGQPAGLRAALIAQAVERLIGALSIDPFEDLAYRRLGLWLPGDAGGGGALHLRYAWRLGPGLVDLVQAFRLLDAAIRPGSNGPTPPGSPEELLGRAQLAVESAALREGETDRVQYLRGVVLFYRHQYAAAIETLEDLRARYPHAFNVAFTLGRAYLDAGQAAKAVPIFEDITHWRVEPGAYHNLALCLTRLGRYQEAEDAYARALALNPEYLPALLNQASMMADDGQIDEARGLLEAAVNARPADPGTLGLLGQLLIRVGDQERGAECLREALVASPSDIGVRVSLAYVLARKEDYSGAFELLKPFVAGAARESKAARQAMRRILETRFYKAEEVEIDGRPTQALLEYREVLRLLPRGDPLRVRVKANLDRLGHVERH